MNQGRDAINNWQKIYKIFFNLNVDFSHLKNGEDYDSKKFFTIVVSRRVSLHDVLRVIEDQYGLEVESGYYPNTKLGSNWSFIKNQHPNNDYLLVIAKNNTPSIPFVRSSFCDWLDNDSPNGGRNYQKSINLLERLLLELYVYYYEGHHLDVDTHHSNRTICVSPNFKNNKYSVYPAVGCDKNGSIYITQHDGLVSIRDLSTINGIHYPEIENSISGSGGRTVLFTYGKRDCLM